jgi:prepilin-type N-terminal cleavage/methylation domain-containing protein
MQFKEQTREAFTLIEVLIVMFIFSIVSLVAITAFLTMFRVGQRATIENAIIEDARYIMDSIITEINNGSIDYEEYFSQCVMSDTCPKPGLETFDFSGDYEDYGQNQGMYAWQFKYGGKQSSDGPTALDDGYGGICQTAILLGDGRFKDYPHEDCITGPLTFSDDTDTGQNPNYNWIDKTYIESNALCSNDSGNAGYKTFENTSTPPGTETKESFNKCDEGGSTNDFYKNLASYMVDEIYLINAEGNQKTILIREAINSRNDYALSKIEMIKNDEPELELDDGDPKHEERSLPLFKFTCAEGYACSESSGTIPKRNDFLYEDGENIFLDAVPISPLKVNVKNLQFIIFPLEDPHRAFAEVRHDFGSDQEPTVQIQPQVTILLEVEPSDQFRLPFISNNFNLKLQTTVSAGVVGEIPIVNEES